MRDDYLFSTHDGHGVQQGTLNVVENEIKGLPEDRILNTDPDALAEYFAEKYDVPVPVLDRDGLTGTQHERMVSVWDHWDHQERKVPGTAFDFEIPFSGDPDVFTIRPNQWDTAPPQAKVRGNMLYFTVADRQLTPEAVKSEVDKLLGSIEKYLGFHQSFWSGFREAIKRKAVEQIKIRRDRLMQSHGVAAGLASMGIKLKEKPGDPRTYVAPAVKQRLQPQMPPMKPKAAPEPTLDKAQYQNILTLIRGAGGSIEQSSSRTRDLDEEALRDMLLVPLNAHFGTVTGEAFNFTGKTDILIRHEGGNLFVAECKFWGGERQFLATIDQLLGYLTWRDTKAAIVIFNRNVGFSAVVEQIKSLPAKHSAFVSGPTRLDETSFEFTMKLPNDQDRHVTISILAFDLGPKS